VSYSIPASGGGGGGGTGAATFSTFTLTKLVDATSPNLLVSAASGRVFPAGRIDLYDPSGTTILTSYELSNLLVLGAVVRSVQVGTSRTLLEEVSLDYQRIKQTVMTPSGPVTGCWDRSQNAAC
jgi:type VI protein secretion system component Hcp